MERPTESTHFGMSNADHTIDDGFEEVLKSGEVYGHHYGWDFCGEVWWYEEKSVFVEQVRQFHIVVDTITAPTLESLMAAVNNEYGSD